MEVKRVTANLPWLILKELSPVEIMNFQWHLSHGVLKDYPPIPEQWVDFDTIEEVIDLMVKCYSFEGARNVTNEILGKMELENDFHQVFNHTCQLPSLPTPNAKAALEPEDLSSKKLDFPKPQHITLVSGLQLTEPIVNALQQQCVLNDLEREAIIIYARHEDKNRALLDLILWKGTEACELFYKVLSELEPLLLKELEKNQPKSESTIQNILALYLDCLVWDELKEFRRYLTQHSVNGCPPIPQNRLDKAGAWQTAEIMELHYGGKLAISTTLFILQTIVPGLTVKENQTWPVVLSRIEPASTTNEPPLQDSHKIPIQITPEVYEDGNMYRLRCPHAGVFQCSITKLILEGEGEVIYKTVYLDQQFLDSKGMSSAGPTFKFKLLKGSFSQLYLPHCEISADGKCDRISVVHVTRERVEFLRPKKMTDMHVIIDITGFSSFGLARLNGSHSNPIKGMVLLFHRPSRDPECLPSLYVLLLPRNALIHQVEEEWRRRIQTAEYIETLPDCELIPNEIYKLSATPSQLIQPEVARFLNYDNYENYTASFEVRLEKHTKEVKIALKCNKGIGIWSWLFPSELDIWNRLIQIHVHPPAENTAGSPTLKGLLYKTLNDLTSKDLKAFQQHLADCKDPIPKCNLETDDRMVMVNIMVQKYSLAGAKDTMVDVLRKMNQNQLAEDLLKGS